MRVAIVGCGVVGAAIAYELSQIPGVSITVLDRQLPAQASTGAALGVLMAGISQRQKGNNLRMRFLGVQRYEEWIPQLESITGRRIPFNRQGILRLCFAGEDLELWRSLAISRQQQGWPLEMLSVNQLRNQCPDLNLDRVIGGVYAPQDRQVDPTALTLALVAAAEQNGVSFQFNTPVTAAGANQLTTPGGPLEFDWLVVAAGVGSTPFANASQHPLEIRPVLGQAMQVQLSQPLGHPDWQPVITGEDVHLVPLGGGSYWVGATVEFAPPGNGQEQSFQPDPAQLEDILHQAIARFPALASATILRRWYGFRPRPEGRPAPVIERVPGHPTVILATGHYRNGVLLAPATAAAVRDMLMPTDSFDQNTATGAGGPYEKKIPDGKPGI